MFPDPMAPYHVVYIFPNLSSRLATSLPFFIFFIFGAASLIFILLHFAEGYTSRTFSCLRVFGPSFIYTTPGLRPRPQEADSKACKNGYRFCLSCKLLSLLRPRLVQTQPSICASRLVLIVGKDSVVTTDNIQIPSSLNTLGRLPSTPLLVISLFPGRTRPPATFALILRLRLFFHRLLLRLLHLFLRLPISLIGPCFPPRTPLSRLSRLPRLLQARRLLVRLQLHRCRSFRPSQHLCFPWTRTLARPCLAICQSPLKKRLLHLPTPWTGQRS